MIWVVVSLVVLWILASMKTSRADGTLVKVHPYRRMMPYIMNGRNESVVYFDTYVDAEKMLAFADAAKGEFTCNVTHCLVGAVSVGLAESPTMNRFIAGRRLYHRNERVITFSMKRKKKDKKAKIGVVRLVMEDGESFRELCGRINGNVKEERTEKKTYMDKELNLFLKLPRPILNAGVSLFKLADYYNLLPKSFIDGDGMFTSVFIANLGSLDMGAGYHHLYEWGTCPLFMMVGKIEERAVVVDGEVVARPMLHIRWSYDERIDDGLTSKSGIDAVVRALENPEKYLTLDTPMATEPADG